MDVVGGDGDLPLHPLGLGLDPEILAQTSP